MYMEYSVNDLDTTSEMYAIYIDFTGVDLTSCDLKCTSNIV